MTVPPESVEVGKCYLMETGHVRRVVRIMQDGRVQYEFRPTNRRNSHQWRPGIQEGHAFAYSAEREVPCDWTPEENE
ncbi:MAG: hypothetical protein M3158_11820 [Pseudomonadota bacterium]|jgi:hypothetical protein|nr:hypothetical protein [Pseudomonadota bacterium]